MEYTTHTNPRLVLRFQRTSEILRVTIEGDAVKTLYEGQDENEARGIYHRTVDQYEQRRKEEGDYRRFDISFEDVKRWYDDGHLDPYPARMANILARVEPDRQEEAIRLALEWAVQVWQSRGAMEAIRHLPPFVRALGGDPDAKRFHAVLHPDLPQAGLTGRLPVDFTEWQDQEVKSLPRGHPTRDAAREKWATRCRADDALQQALGELSRCYEKFVRFAAEEGQFLMYDMYPENRRYYARGGEPDCGHVEVVGQCEHSCKASRREAYEAHHGWRVPEDWLPPTTRSGQPFQGRSEGCACCEKDHDFTPLGEVQCALCAEAQFWCRAEVVARRWGGWLWVCDAIRESAKSMARTEHPDLIEFERRKGLLNELHPSLQPSWEWELKLGGHPWQRSFTDDWVTDSYGQRLATFYVPVPMFTIDLKKDVRKRLGLIFDSLWQRAGLKVPKSTALTKRRSDDWDRYIDWLWQHRVLRLPVERIENAGSRVNKDEVVSPRAINVGIDRALRTLSAV